MQPLLKNLPYLRRLVHGFEVAFVIQNVTKRGLHDIDESSNGLEEVLPYQVDNIAPPPTIPQGNNETKARLFEIMDKYPSAGYAVIDNRITALGSELSGIIFHVCNAGINQKKC